MVHPPQVIFEMVPCFSEDNVATRVARISFGGG